MLDLRYDDIGRNGEHPHGSQGVQGEGAKEESFHQATDVLIHISGWILMCPLKLFFLPRIVAVSAHAAFAKAAHYFDVELVVAPVDDVTMEIDLNAVRKAINPNVIMVHPFHAPFVPHEQAKAPRQIVGSAPGYPHGVIDNIEELAKIAQQHDVGMHVDGCLGGFLLPWLRKLGNCMAHILMNFPP